MKASQRAPGPKGKKAIAELASLRLVVLTDVYVFARVLLGYRDMTPDFHGAICDHMMTTPYQRNLYLVPRDNFKTSVITIAGLAQDVLRDPQATHLIASAKLGLASDMLRELKGHLTNPLLVEMFPEILWPDPERQATEQWSATQICVKRARRLKESTIETIGVEGEITSKHYDTMRFDDIVGRENSQTREQLEGAIQFFKDAQGLTKPTTRQWYIGTTWHYADVWAWLQEQRAKGVIQMGLYKRGCWEPTTADDPAGHEVPSHGRVRATFPERWPVPRLLEQRKIEGDLVFNAQRLLDPLDESTAVFKRSLLNVRARAQMPPLEDLWLAMAVDPAISEHKWADYSAVAVGGFDRTGMLWILDLRRGRWSETVLLQQIYDMWATTPGIRAIGFEAIGFAKSYRRLFTVEGERLGFYLPVVTLERDTRTAKATRILSLEPYWSRGHVFIADHVPALADFQDEADRFRVGKDSVHDDMLDAVADLLQLRQRPAAAPPAESLIDDPEALERQHFEYQAQQQRQASGKPALDDFSLKLAWAHHRHYQAKDREREMLTVGNGSSGEFWGGV